MTKEELAAQLDGIKYPAYRSITKEQFAAARESGLVIVYGASDDLMEFDGAIRDEFGCYEGGTAFIDKNGLIDRSQIDDDDDEAIHEFVERKKSGHAIEAFWCKRGEYTWAYETSIPHATFTITNEEELYCRGLVFSITDLT